MKNVRCKMFFMEYFICKIKYFLLKYFSIIMMRKWWWNNSDNDNNNKKIQW
jgi:hypothetical protein